MISASLLLLLSAGAVGDAPAATKPLPVITAPPQGPSLGQSYNQNTQSQNPGGGLPPSGGTPEPGLLLLIAGGGLAYGAVRLRKKKDAPTES